MLGGGGRGCTESKRTDNLSGLTIYASLNLKNTLLLKITNDHLGLQIFFACEGLNYPENYCSVIERQGVCKDCWKMASIDLLDTGLSQTFNLLKLELFVK